MIRKNWIERERGEKDWQIKKKWDGSGSGGIVV